MMKKLSLIALVLGAITLQGCVSEQDAAMAHKVITALPQEIEGCSFIDDVDSHSSIMMEGARFDLKMKAAKLGATHVVETFAIPVVVTRSMLGVSLSGRAYKCPLGKGPLVNNDTAYIKYEIPEASSVLGDGPGDFPGFLPRHPLFQHHL